MSEAKTAEKQPSGGVPAPVEALRSKGKRLLLGTLTTKQQLERSVSQSLDHNVQLHQRMTDVGTGQPGAVHVNTRWRGT